MNNAKTETTVFSAKGVNGVNGEMFNKVNGDSQEKIIDSAFSIPRPRTPAELLQYIKCYVSMLHDIKGLTSLGTETLTAADEMLTRGQCAIRKAMSEIKRREEGQLQLHFAVRNAFYGVAKTYGEDDDVMLAEARAVALSVGRQLNLPEIEKYVSSLELEYKSGAKRTVTATNAGTETTAKYRITIDGKIVSEKCRRNNMELARILYKHGITEGEKSEDCKALGIDITAINNINDTVEYRIKRRHLKIDRIK